MVRFVRWYAPYDGTLRTMVRHETETAGNGPWSQPAQCRCTGSRMNSRGNGGEGEDDRDTDDELMSNHEGVFGWPEDSPADCNVVYIATPENMFVLPTEDKGLAFQYLEVLYDFVGALMTTIHALTPPNDSLLNYQFQKV
ncbi:hypothetical protein BV898_13660 [Hypsibius exemplaris]|uniref:Uncharacterized protein n=1 Tax=Hypsibius exemplaris TaxID=2072580 RepID=A0A1W0WAB2_HYPEX|nr:hypothetical protein BV898_13660 [Hypsibius exemplaris]